MSKAILKWAGSKAGVMSVLSSHLPQGNPRCVACQAVSELKNFHYKGGE